MKNPRGAKEKPGQPEDMVRLNVDITRDMRTKLKVFAALHDLSVSELIKARIEELIEDGDESGVELTRTSTKFRLILNQIEKVFENEGVL